MVSVLPEVKLPALHVMHDVAPFSLYNLTSPHAAHFSSAPAENFPLPQRGVTDEPSHDFPGGQVVHALRRFEEPPVV